MPRQLRGRRPAELRLAASALSFLGVDSATGRPAERGAFFASGHPVVAGRAVGSGGDTRFHASAVARSRSGPTATWHLSGAPGSLVDELVADTRVSAEKRTCFLAELVAKRLA